MAKTARAARKGAAADGAADLAGRRDVVLEAAMVLAGRTGWRRLTLAEIAAEAGVTLAELYGAFPDKAGILRHFGRRIDERVLAGTGADMAAESRRDRLFDVLMRRFDALVPYRDGVRALSREAVRDPSLALCGAPGLLRAMAWSLEAAGIRADGLAGVVRTKALAVLYLSVLRVWLEDESPDMAATMAALDARLGRADRILGV